MKKVCILGLLLGNLMGCLSSLYVSSYFHKHGKSCECQCQKK